MNKAVQTRIKEQIEELMKIDDMVYALYGVTADERSIVRVGIGFPID